MSFNKLIKPVIMNLTFIVATALFGQACAAKKMAIRNADSLIEHKLSKTFPVDSSQKEALARDVENFLNESKSHIAEIKEALNDLQFNKANELDTDFTRISGLYQQLAFNYSKVLAAHMARLTKDQQDELFENLARENKKINLKTSDQRLKEQEDRLEYLFGVANQDQIKFMKDNDAYFDSQTQKRLDRRNKLHAKFKEIYSFAKTPREKEELFNRAYADYQQEVVITKDYKELIKKLLPTLSPGQIAHFKRQIQEINELLDYFMEVKY